MNLILENVHKSYGTHHVLKGINLNVNSGRAMGLLGRNGSGKTTMIRGIMDVFDFDDGKIHIEATADEIGYLPEERGVYPKSTLLEQMIYFAMLKGMSKKDAKTKALYWIDRMDLNTYTNKKADSLSKGNQQKIQLAISLMHDPKVLILDEPFSGLDPVNSELLKTIVREEIDKGKIVFFSSHQMATVEEFCDDIAILNNGKIVLEGDLREIKSNYPKEKIRIYTHNLEKLEAELKALDTISEMLLDGDSIVIRLSDISNIFEDAKALNNRLEFAQGYKIVEPSLEEIFIEYGRDLR